MPNARDTKITKPPVFLIGGTTGAGKTTQFLTLPGKKFLYIFDPNCLRTIEGFDVEYELFLPEDVDIGAVSLAKGKSDIEKVKSAHELYERWEKHYDTKKDEGYFDQFDVIGVDSFTTFSEMVMDKILHINGRAGQWPQQDDYPAQMLTITKVIREFTSLNKIVYITAHVQPLQDELMKTVSYQFVMTGQLKSKLPLLFSEILIADADVDQKKQLEYTIQTKKDRNYPNIRCTRRNLQFRENVTIDWNKDPVGQGLGGLYFN